jgi:hypothetical protein
MPPRAFAVAAQAVGCAEAIIRAVWQVEAGGRGFLSDGSVVRRFEPHKMPGSRLTWRDSLAIGTKQREAMFLEAYRSVPVAALEATSWGGPQIMGFNARAAGYSGAGEMVAAMAESEEAHLSAFVSLITSWGLDSALRAQDWNTFATRYNGAGQAAAYARKTEAAYRSLSGKASPTVLRQGASGAAVRRLQEALSIVVDGSFGPATDVAVRRFQEAAGLPVDGVVGVRTWEALEAQRNAKPTTQPTTADDVADKVKEWGGIAGTVAAIGAAVQEAMPEGAYALLAYGAVALALMAVGALVLRKVRDAA